ncbi:EH domain-containing protein 4 [Poecilia latipinna]|uniref:EH-domain containing 4 n=5 Tax=Poecilia TaxID=8080 RepID=A0A087YKR3_POEFO|nr:PREDICTED: EH domain-containing protein 4-like isoform X1 [Poecilia formosa]XP_014832198.1 PREDICTED: EH domain-containing protein 4-like isoform X1 [Poecilia mexicana]XP_014892065.1 PREDICTED: EH domain-containing protein 4-like [Poecilia latipinna]XP_017158128.1 PREDICTED: EH domain-containing protein 4-like isoform X1 [Poecilia reticulata]
MFSWVKQEQGGRNKEGEMYQTVTEGLQTLYTKKLLPLEETYLFHDFHSPALEGADFQSKPMVLLVGQYSTGKTTFIRYLLEQDFPGMRIGPEPTTDGFIAVMHGETEGVVPGNALVVDPKKPFRKLNAFGNSFLNRFICSQMPNQVLQSISIIDTPGILSGEKQRISRGYDFAEVLRWFGERVDRIILLFDAHKLDISDEFSEAIKAFKGQDDKIRVVLNKADQVDTQQLMRVYGALMWSLGKVINTPEVVRVYLGSFWAKPLQNTENRRLFEAESQDLFRDIQSLPRNAALRKLNDLIKRARLAKVHAYIISYLKKEMPSLFGREKKKEELIMRLPEIYITLQREHHISPGDFPNVTKMQDMLQHYDFSKFPSLKMKLIESVDKMLATKIAVLMAMIREEESKLPPAMVSGGAFEGSEDGPFGRGYGEGISAGADADDWIVSRDKHRYDEIFYTLMPVNGKITGVNAKKEMMNSRLPNTVLGKIWKLADCDQDGMLDDEEFALAQHLIQIKLEGYELPNELPNHLVPPAHRKNPTADALYNHTED